METRANNWMRPLVLIAAVSGLAVAGQAFAAASPTLTSADGPGLPARPSSPSNPEHPLAIIELQLSLQRLAAPESVLPLSPTAAAPAPAPADASQLQSLLAGLGRASLPDDSSAWVLPRLSEPFRYDVSHARAQEFMASVAADLARADQALGAAPPRTAGRSAAAMDVSDLREAMQRFPQADASVASDTFIKVFLGLSDALPRLSREVIAHAEVDKAALRSRVVERKLARRADHSPVRLEAPEVQRTAAFALVEPQVPVADMVAGDVQIAGLIDAPVDDRELYGSAPYPDADLQGLHLDDTLLALDELGGDTLAALESPVAADQLQETRAGFVLDNGVHIDFNVTRMTVVDGVEQLRTVINLPQGIDQAALAQVSAAQGATARVITPGDNSSMFSVIQNQIDNVGVLDLTTVNVDIKNFGLRNVNFVRPGFQADAIPPYLR